MKVSNFGEILKILRKNAHMTQQELADALWISKSTVSCYEQDTRFPSSEILVKIANVFHVSVDYLLGREQKQQILDITDLKDEDVEFLCTTISFLKAKNHVRNKEPIT